VINNLQTYSKLGFGNVARVALYRALLKTNLHSVQRIKANAPAEGSFYSGKYISSSTATADLDLPWLTHHVFFGWEIQNPASPPDWFGKASGSATKNWWDILDFNPDVGDIKCVWEASRFEWLQSFALAAKSGDTGRTEQMNSWLADWWHRNPPFKGPNWKCAQEASIRVLRLVFAAHILGELRTASKPLLDAIEIHLARIAPTLGYAKGQQNNHATSEAAALWVGGLFLKANGRGDNAIASGGKAALASSIMSLVLPDGSFSQSSSNYHRFLLDTLCIAELLRRALSSTALDDAACARIREAIHWLSQFTDQASGEPVNLGHNDSAYLLPNKSGQDRNFLLTLGIANALFNGYVPQHCMAATAPLLSLLDETRSVREVPALRSHLFADGGYAVLREQDAMAMLRLPQFTFRPSHCDALHLDLWVGGLNILRDAGTASYVSEIESMPDLSTTRAHNTIQFDEDEQMPRLSRFLWGDWLKPDGPIEFLEHNGGKSAGAAYVDRRKRRHDRKVKLQQARLDIIDTVRGRVGRSILRWHLCRDNWQQTSATEFCCGPMVINMTSNTPITAKLTPTPEALRYRQVSEAMCIEASFEGQATVETHISWGRR
jgi:hypothetical protein